MNKKLGLEIPDYPGYYVTSNGDIWSTKQKKPRKLKPQKVSQSKKKYLQVRLFNKDSRKGKVLINGKTQQRGKLQYIHRLVYQNFVGEITKGKEIDHKDSNTHNNNVDNLQVITRRENLMKYAKKLSKENNRRYLRNYRDEVIEDFKNLKAFAKVAKKWNCSEQHVRRIIKNVYYMKNKEVVFDESINDKWMNTDLRNIRHNEEFWL